MRSEYDDSKFNFVKASKPCFIASIAVTIIGILALIFMGFNYGIDFSSGTVVDISTTKAVSDDEAKQFLDSRDFGEYTLTTSENRLSIRFKDPLTEQQELQLKTDFNAQVDDKATYEVNIVDAEIAKEQQRNALIGIALASVGIVIYMAIRFEWRFGIAAIVSLIHDAFIVISVFSIFQLEVNLTFISAVLTIIGYSVNDTVVIFDRIRENLRFAKIKKPADLEMLVNRSVWQTLTRSITTGITVLLAAICLFIFGSESIRLFSLAMIVGLVCGAYSSIFIASPLWILLRGKNVSKKASKASSAT